MSDTRSNRAEPPILDRIDCIVVFSDGSSHFARLTRDVFLQWGGTLDKIQSAAPLLDALRRSLAAALGAKRMVTPETERVRRRIAALHSKHAVELITKTNPTSQVDYSDPKVIALSRMNGSALISQHDAGNGEPLALLCKIADEEGWS